MACSGKLQASHYFWNINFRKGSSLGLRLEREIKATKRKALVCLVKELVCYLVDDAGSLKSFKQGSGTVSKEGYKQTNRVGMGLGAETRVQKTSRENVMNLVLTLGV